MPRTELPATVRTLDKLDIVKAPVNVTRPLLSMVRRSTSCVLAVDLVLLVELVLNTKLPPKLPVASYATRHT